MSLLSDIENAAANSSTPIGDLLRKCKVLAVRLQDAKFAAWVHYELNGYPRDQETELPSYRKTKLPIAMGHFAGPFGSGLKNAPIPIGLLPTELAANFENILLVEPVAELETFAAASEPLKRKWPGDVIAYVAHHHEIYEGMNLVDAWNPMSPAMFRGVIDAVRSRVLDFALAIERANPNAGDVAPNAPAPVAPQTVSNIFHTMIYGGNSNVGTTGSARIDNSDPITTITLADNKAHELAGLVARAQAEATTQGNAEALATIEKVDAAVKQKKLTPANVKEWATTLQTVATTGAVAAPHLYALAHWIAHFL